MMLSQFVMWNSLFKLSQANNQSFVSDATEKFPHGPTKLSVDSGKLWVSNKLWGFKDKLCLLTFRRLHKQGVGLRVVEQQFGELWTQFGFEVKLILPSSSIDVWRFVFFQPTSQFDLISHRQQNLTFARREGDFSTLQVSFNLQRHTGYFLIQVLLKLRITR